MSPDTALPTRPASSAIAHREASPDRKVTHVLDIIRLVRGVLELLLSLGQPLRIMLIQPLITVAMLLVLYAGWHIRDEGSISAGLQVAFVDTKAFRTEHLRELETALLQTELHQAAQSDRLIDQLLRTLLTAAPTAARVRLDVVHNGITGVTGTALLRYDITNSVAAPGHDTGQMALNQPLSDWNEILPTLLAGKCQIGVVAAASSTAFRVRLEAMGTGAYLACPVIDVQGRVLGAVFVQWDAQDAAPTGSALQTLMDHAINVGVQIASALDLRTPLPYPIEVQSTE